MQRTISKGMSELCAGLAQLSTPELEAVQAAATAELALRSQRSQRLHQLFELADRDGSGYLEIEEARIPRQPPPSLSR